jgi:pSer/pThr/pTyr-binding forkhead associated (FHA) protein
MFKLVIQDDEGKTTVVPLIRDEITIGRKEGNTIRLTERNVSRRHARIVRANGAVAIEDLGSYNGVRVNGTRIAQRTSLSVSDRVQIGDYLIELKAEGVEQVADDSKTQPIERMDGELLVAQLGAAAVPGAAPVASVGLADTDPSARPVAAIAAAPIGQSSAHARVVVLSSNFPGQEWELSRPQMIIGRTDDNDIVVNHRSISRNHAKLVREPETGRYTISDLQSSNGVRVNGEEYGKVELRRGDVIDLGHVRLRFIEPGEDFVFGRDAQIADVPTSGRGKGLMIAAAVALLGIGAIAIVILTRSDDGKKKKNDGGLVASGSGSGSGPGPTNIVVDDGSGSNAIMPTAADAAPTNDIGTKLEECRGLRDAEDWGGTIKCANELLAKMPGNPDAPDLVEQAKREMANKLLLDDLKTAAGKKDFQETIRLHGKIPSDSIYAKRAAEIHDKLRDNFIDDEVAKAKAFAAKHQCKDIDKRAAQVGKIWSEAGKALSDIPCEKVDTTANNNNNTKPDPECKVDGDCSGGKVCKSGSCAAAPTPSPDCDDAALLQEARDAGQVNQWSKVLQKAEASNKCKANKTARQLALLAACRLGQKDKAMKYWKEFENNAMSKQQCINVIGGD